MRPNLAVVGLETQPLKGRPPLVVGLFAMKKDGEIARCRGFKELSAYLLEEQLWPQRLPLEEGWDNAVDLSPSLWSDLLAHLTIEFNKK